MNISRWCITDVLSLVPWKERQCNALIQIAPSASQHERQRESEAGKVAQATQAVLRDNSTHLQVEAEEVVAGEILRLLPKENEAKSLLLLRPQLRRNPSMGNTRIGRGNAPLR